MAVLSFDRKPLNDPRLNRRGRWLYGPWGPDGGRAVTYIASKRCGATLRGHRARAQTCGKIVGHSGGRAFTEVLEAAYARAVAKRYPSGLYGLRARLASQRRR